MPDYANVRGTHAGMDAPPQGFFSITPHDTNELSSTTRALWVGVTGNVTVDGLVEGTNITIANVPVGYLSGQFTRVYSTGTTASSILGVY